MLESSSHTCTPVSSVVPSGPSCQESVCRAAPQLPLFILSRESSVRKVSSSNLSGPAPSAMACWAGLLYNHSHSEKVLAQSHCRSLYRSMAQISDLVADLLLARSGPYVAVQSTFTWRTSQVRIGGC